MELHHVEHHRDGGTNNRENLVTLCNVCHDVVHKKKVAGNEFWNWLGEAANRTSRTDG